MRTYVRVFDDIDKLREMLELRKKGYSFLKLANIYNVDHSSIIYQVQKHRVIQPLGIKKVRLVKKGIIPTLADIKQSMENLEYEKGERINPGKSYKEYLKDEEKRKFNNLVNKFK